MASINTKPNVSGQSIGNKSPAAQPRIYLWRYHLIFPHELDAASVEHRCDHVLGIRIVRIVHLSSYLQWNTSRAGDRGRNAAKKSKNSPCRLISCDLAYHMCPHEKFGANDAYISSGSIRSLASGRSMLGLSDRQGCLELDGALTHCLKPADFFAVCPDGNLTEVSSKSPEFLRRSSKEAAVSIIVALAGARMAEFGPANISDQFQT